MGTSKFDFLHFPTISLHTVLLLSLKSVVGAEFQNLSPIISNDIE